MFKTGDIVILVASKSHLYQDYIYKVGKIRHFSDFATNVLNENSYMVEFENDTFTCRESSLRFYGEDIPEKEVEKNTTDNLTFVAPSDGTYIICHEPPQYRRNISGRWIAED